MACSLIINISVILGQLCYVFIYFIWSIAVVYLLILLLHVNVTGFYIYNMLCFTCGVGSTFIYVIGDGAAIGMIISGESSD